VARLDLPRPNLVPAIATICIERVRLDRQCGQRNGSWA